VHLQRVHVGQKILNLLLAQGLAVAWHSVAPPANNDRDSLVIRRKSAQRKVLMLENALQSRTFLALGGIRLMAAVALRVVDFSPGNLLRIQPKFRIRLPPLHIASRRHEHSQPQEQTGKSQVQSPMTQTQAHKSHDPPPFPNQICLHFQPYNNRRRP
jgi:hypothetical protein